jgi:hypothetical protein
VTKLLLSDREYNEVAARVLVSFTRDASLVEDFFFLRSCSVWDGHDYEKILVAEERILTKLAQTTNRSQETIRMFLLDLAEEIKEKDREASDRETEGKGAVPLASP